MAALKDWLKAERVSEQNWWLWRREEPILEKSSATTGPGLLNRGTWTRLLVLSGQMKRASWQHSNLIMDAAVIMHCGNTSILSRDL